MVSASSKPISDESPGVLYQDMFEKTLEAQLADLEKKLRELPEYKTMDRRLTQLLIERLKDKIRVQDEAEAAREELDFKLENAKKDLAETPESRPALRELRLLMVKRLENEIRVQNGVEPESIQPSEGIARRALQEAKEARAGLLMTPTDHPQRESVPTKLERPSMPIESSDRKGQLINSVQTRSYRWGKFQGWTTFVIGLVTFLPTPFMGGGIFKQLIEYTAGALLIVLGLGLAQKRRFGLVLLYSQLPLFLLGFAFLDMPRFEIVFAVCWYFIPAAFYYPKRWKEFSRDEPGGVSSVKPNTNRLKSVQTALLNKLKDAGWVVLGIMMLLAIVAVVGVFLGAAEALSEYVLPWCIRIAFWGFLALTVVLLPASLVRRWRSFTSPAMLVLSYLFGATVWMDGLVLTMTIWGDGAVIFGLFLLGVGVVPIAMLATLFQGMWGRLAELVVLTLLIFVSRFLAFWIGGMRDAEE